MLADYEQMVLVCANESTVNTPTAQVGGTLRQ